MQNMYEYRALFAALKMPKCEIFDRSDFHYIYTIKPFWVDDFVVKILTYYFKFEGARPHLVFDAQAEHTRKELMRMLSMRISSLRACSVNASVPDANAQHSCKALFKFGIFTLMLSIRMRN
jgi:hypothetical protein